MICTRRGRIFWLLFASLGMLATAVLLLPFPRSLICFLVIWLIHLAYNLPPIRLKERGIWGVFCIAAGEHLLAALLATLLTLEASHKTPPAFWMVALVIWSAALGMRSILWHQLCDFENDRVAGAQTFGGRFSYNFLRRLGERAVFPAEAIAFATLLGLSGNLYAWGLLVIHLYYEWALHRFTEANFTLVAPAVYHRFALFEYYQLFWPLAFLLPRIGQDRTALLFLAIQAALLPGTIRDSALSLWGLLRWRLWVHIRTGRKLPLTPGKIERLKEESISK